MSNSKNWLELLLKYDLHLKQRKKYVGEADYGKVSRKSKQG